MVFRGEPSHFQDFGYFVRGTEWASPIIYVCWENPSEQNKRTRMIVKDQIEATWQLYTLLEFRGWETCAAKNAGIRIKISDEGAHVKEFGKRIDGIKEGMVLNDTFKAWRPDCPGTHDQCIRAIAVHEFGHALGFAHEHNRPDKPGECATAPEGQPKEQMLTPYDPNSVMNYCNRNNHGDLSDLDIKAAQKIYGARR
jgi:hypothetical protein